MFLSLALACAGAEPDTASEPGPALQLDAPPANLLMISLDTLRRDRVGRYGGGGDTPFLDGLLADGVALDDHRSCSNYTYGALICALSGWRELELGFVPVGSADELPPPLPDEVLWLPQRLRGAGFATALASSNHFLSENFDTDRGYDLVRFENNQRAEILSTQALSLYGELATSERWFLHVHLIDPHDPYVAPDGYRADAPSPVEADLGTAAGLWLVTEGWEALSEDERAAVIDHVDGLYREELRYLDDQLAALFASLEAAGALEDTLVVLWSDHGEQFWERGSPTHGQDLFREEIDAIAAFLAPGLAPLAWDGPTSHLDLQPTIFSALGLGVVEGSGAVLGRAGDSPRFALSYANAESQLSVILGDQMMLSRWDQAAPEVYHRALDPGESEDRYDPTDPAHQALWTLLGPERAALAALFPELNQVTAR